MRFDRIYVLGLMVALLSACGDNTGGQNDAASTADQSMSATVDGPPSDNHDLAHPDLASPEDLRVVDLAHPDLTHPPDLTAPPDLSVAHPGCVMHSLANATCTDIDSWLKEWLACNQTCTTNNDCVLLGTHFTPCINSCPAVANTMADGAYYQSLMSAFMTHNCGHAGCACINHPQPLCHSGVCM